MVKSYRAFYEQVHKGIYAMYDAGRNPKRLTIGAEEFGILHEVDAATYNLNQSEMYFMGLEVVLSDEPSLLQIDEQKRQHIAPVIVPEQMTDVQISLFD